MSTHSLFYDSNVIRSLIEKVGSSLSKLDRSVKIMEVCGTHTHVIAKAGLRKLLPGGVDLISGPGCPVCVTPVDYLDRAEALAGLPGKLVCTFGDLFRVPSSTGSLERVHAEGRQIKIVYSPRDALEIAKAEPEREVIFLAIGFETTIPTIAAALDEAEMKNIPNFRILPGGKIMPPPLHALAGAEEIMIDGFLLPGHVSVIIGARAYEFLAEKYHIPSVVTGFTPADILRAIHDIVQQVITGTPRVANLYSRVVTDEGNPAAKRLIEKYFEPVDAVWRGLGPIPGSGLALKEEWRHRDASAIPVELPEPKEPEGCRCGDVLKGVIDPPACPLFGAGCTPDDPVGACMVSSEGTCAAWYRHHR